jgi:hypothetical protein
MGKHGLAPLLARLLEDDVFLHRGHPLAAWQVSMDLILRWLPGIVPFLSHETISISRVR